MRYYALLILWLSSSALAAQNYVPLDLLKNINTGITAGVEVPVVAAGNKAYFIYSDYNSYYGPQLGVTDGTAAGTKIIREWRNEQYLGPGSPYELIPMGNSVFISKKNELWFSDGTLEGTILLTKGIVSFSLFCAIKETNIMMFNVRDNQFSTTNLWRSDGTVAGTYAIGGVKPHFVNRGDDEGKWYYFNGGTSSTSTDYELWRTDGTTEGTHLVKDLLPGAGGSNITNFTGSNGKMFFTTLNYLNSHSEVFVTDGTAAGTIMLTDLNVFLSPLPPMVSFKDEVYFPSTAGLNKTDGTVQGTVLVKSFTNGFPFNFKATNDKLFFAATQPATGFELWATDGTTDGTNMVYDLIPGTTGSINPGINYSVIGNDLYLLISPSVGVSELWKTDGTNTVKLQTGSGPDLMYNLTALNDRLLFSRKDTGLSANIWTNSTTGVLSKIKEFGSNPGNANGSLAYAQFNGMTYFNLESGNSRGLWRTNGADITEVFLDMSISDGFTVLNNKLYFSAYDETHGIQLWSTDGTIPGTARITDFDETDGELNGGIFVWENKIFVSTYAFGKTRVWVSDGTTAGTTLLRDGEDGVTAIIADHTTEPMNGYLYFAAVRNAQTAELWRTDGTPAGTEKVSAIMNSIPGNNVSLGSLTVVNNIMVMIAGSGPKTQLWRSDGTAAGTLILREEMNSRLGGLTEYNGTLYLTAFSDETWLAMFKTDGNAVELAYDVVPGNDQPGNPMNFQVINGAMYFWYNHGYPFLADRYELWKLEGTNPPVSLGLFKTTDIFLTRFNDKFFFTAEGFNDGKGREIWISDGTPAGTKILRDTNPMFPGTTIDHINVLSDAFYFRTTDERGRQVWRSDGTTCNTLPMTDLSYAIQRLYPLNEQTFIVNALNPETGTELYAYERSLEPVTQCREQQYIYTHDIYITYGDSPINLWEGNNAIVASSDLAVNFELSNENVLSITNGLATIIGAGQVLITSTQPGNSTYEPAQAVTSYVSVKKRQQVVTMVPVTGKKFGDVDFELTATSDSENPITFISSNPEVISITGSNGNFAVINKAGVTTITATQAGDQNNIAGTATTELSIGKATQTISFTISDVPIGDATLQLTANSSGGLPINYETSDDDAVIVDHFFVLFEKAGRTSIIASQAGDDNYLPATPVTKEFCINPSKPSIVANTVNPAAPTLTSPSATNVWYHDGVPLLETDAVLNVSASGSYNVKTSVEGCVSPLSEDVVIVVLGTEDEYGLYGYPNPVSTFYHLPGITSGTYMISDVTGRRVTSGNVASDGRFDLSNYSAGTYVIAITNTDRVTRIKVVKD